MTAMRLKRYPSASGGFAIGKMGVGATLMSVAKTAKDYVQDGLVAMWDGIENAGWGVHDPNATTWKDLIGTRDLTVNSTGTFTEKSLHKDITSGNTAAAQVAGRTNFSTWEYCFSVEDSGDKPRIKTGRYGVCVLSTPYDGAVYCGANDLGAGFLVPTGVSQGISISYCGDTLHVNGSVAEKNGLTVGYSGYQDMISFLLGGMTADLFCVRAYSRALTADEIAANSAIDKERFNRP